MTSEQPLSDKSIIDCLCTKYGIKAFKLTLLITGADINAFLYKVEASDQSLYFIKIKQLNHQIVSCAILELLHDAGVKRIISPIKGNNGQSYQLIAGYDLTVFPFIQGQDGFHRDLTDNQWFALGKVMRQLHEINVPSSIQSKIRRENYSPKWREIVRSLYVHIESEPSSDEISSDFMAVMKSQAKIIHQLVDRAEQLASKLRSESPDFVLCHADIHGGNVLIADKGDIYIVDWDEAMIAPKERDLMFIGAGVANAWNRPHEEELFYQGYGGVKINMPVLAYYRCERIVEDIAVYGEQLLCSGNDDARAESYQHFIAQFEPNGVVEIALTTGE